MTERLCTACRTGTLEAGFLEDMGESSQGYTRWIPGALELGVFGGAKKFRKQRIPVHAWRCPTCHHLDLYAPPDE